jgi:hypothetical protein
LSDYQPAQAAQEQKLTALKTLENVCEQSAEDGEEIVLAVRVFPDTEYHYFYKRPEIIYVQTKLTLKGYQFEIKTVMTEKLSRLVLVVEKRVLVQREVKAELMNSAQKKLDGQH